MAIELKVPSAGESVTEVTIVEWLKAEGSWAQPDEIVALIETDKANVEVVAPVGGTITRILKSVGDVAQVGEVIGHMEVSERPAKAEAAKAEEAPAKTPDSPPQPIAQAPAASAPPSERVSSPAKAASVESPAATPPAELRASPSLRRALREGRVEAPSVRPELPSGPGPAHRGDETVAMTPLRRRIAERLVEAQNNAALLTTFNEVDLSNVLKLRAEYQERFKSKYGIKLGFMSFFVKAVIEGLKAFPALNAEIRGTDIVYHNYYDIGVAVGGGRGLVVPVIRNAERLSFSEIERQIVDFAVRAKENKLKVDELQGGSFTVSNGGVYGSLLSTPIVNPPQSGILGMHSIQERPVVRDGQITIGKMMYIALTYDHRIVDGREAVSFLVRVKECVENPSRVLLEV